jgi:hypothetical protein
VSLKDTRPDRGGAIASHVPHFSMQLSEAQISPQMHADDETEKKY